MRYRLLKLSVLLIYSFRLHEDRVVDVIALWQVSPSFRGRADACFVKLWAFSIAPSTAVPLPPLSYTKADVSKVIARKRRTSLGKVVGIRCSLHSQINIS